MRPKRLLLGILATALLALPATAPGATRSRSVTVSGDFAVASATATCPSGQRATGGGFTNPSPIAPFTYIFESRKVGQRSWRASGQILDPGATNTPRAVTAYVYCSKDAPSTKTKSAIVTSGAIYAIHSADAKCSSGQAQAGGFAGPQPNAGGGVPNHLVDDSYRVDKKTWRARMSSGGATPGVAFTSYVYCANEKRPAARLGSTTTTGPAANVTVLSASCKGGTKLVAGGFSQPNARLAPGPAGAFGPFRASLKSGKRWLVTAGHTGPISTTLNSIAYCA